MTENDKITPRYITSLREGEIFVFGSNKEGMHGGGAARARKATLEFEKLGKEFRKQSIVELK